VTVHRAGIDPRDSGLLPCSCGGRAETAGATRAVLWGRSSPPTEYTWSSSRGFARGKGWQQASKTPCQHRPCRFRAGPQQQGGGSLPPPISRAPASVLLPLTSASSGAGSSLDGWRRRATNGPGGSPATPPPDQAARPGQTVQDPRPASASDPLAAGHHKGRAPAAAVPPGPGDHPAHRPQAAVQGPVAGTPDPIEALRRQLATGQAAGRAPIGRSKAAFLAPAPLGAQAGRSPGQAPGSRCAQGGP